VSAILTDSIKNEWINQQQRVSNLNQLHMRAKLTTLQNASLVARTNGALDGSLPFHPSLIVLPSASRASEQNFFDDDSGNYNTQSDADTEVQPNAEWVDDFLAANIEAEPEQDGNWEADLFDEDIPHAAETSSDLVEEQTVAAVDQIKSSEPILVSEHEMHRSPQLPQNLYVDVPGSRPAQDPIAPDSQEAIDSTTQLLQSRVPGAGAGTGHQQIPNVVGVHIVVPASAGNISGNQTPRSIAPNVPSTTGVHQPPATTNTGGRRGRYIPRIQTRPPRTRGPLQTRPVPVWPEFLHVTPAVRANAAGHEAALRMITHARNVPTLKTVGNTDLITSTTRTGGTPGDWKPVVIANFLNEWIRRNHNGLELWKKEGKNFREQINWYDRRPLMEQADIRIFIAEQVEALLPAADQQRIAQLRQNFQPPGSQLTTQVANGTWQPPIFGPPSAAFLALVAAHDAAQAATQVNSGAQMNQMGSGPGSGPFAGIGGVPSSSQPAAGSGGFGANSLAAGGLQAPHQAQSANPRDSRKRNRDDAGSDDDEDSPNSHGLPAPPPSSTSSFATGMHEQPGHLAGYGAPYSVAPYSVYGAPAHAPYGQQMYYPQQTPYDQSAQQSYDAPQGSFEQQQYLHPQPLYDQPVPHQDASPALDPWMQPSNPAGFDFENLDPALFELPGLSSGPSLPTEDDSREVSEDIDMLAESRRPNPRLSEDEEDADRIEAYWRNEESRARGGLAARPEVFGFGTHGPSMHRRGSSMRGTKRGASDDEDEGGDGGGRYSVQERARGKRHRK
jgi:hypothetical protein